MSLGIALALHDLEQEPLAALRFVENLLQSVTGRRVALLVTHFNRCTDHLRDVRVVIHQPFNHLTGRNKVVVVVVDGLQLADMADTANSCAPDAAHAFGHDVNRLKDSFGLLVEQQVIVASASLTGASGSSWS